MTFNSLFRSKGKVQQLFQFSSIQWIHWTTYLLFVLNKSHTLRVGQQWCAGLKDTILTQIIFFLYSVLKYFICPYCAVILAIGRRSLWKRTGTITIAHSFCVVLCLISERLNHIFTGNFHL